MPSGFVQDSNQLAPGFYRVVWAASAGTYATADGNDNGAIGPTSADNVGSGKNQISALPTTLVASKRRVRGNMRFRNIVNRLSGLADCQILDIECGGQTDGDSQPSSIAFTVKYERDAGVLDAVKNLIGSPYTAIDGSTTVTTTVLAIKDQFVRGFRDATTANVRVYDPTQGSGDTQQAITVAPPSGATAANMWTDTTVLLIDGTELITADETGAAE
jgi:hypothetical protein